MPLRTKDGSVRAYALIDDEDAVLAQYRWSLDSKGYAARTLPRGVGERRRELLHRVVLGLSPGDGLECDHVNGNRLNCCRSNLRVVTRHQNMQNFPSQRGSISRYRGVTWDMNRGKWIAQACINRKKFFLGRFDDEEEAARVAQDFRVANMTHTNEDRMELVP